MKPSPPLRIALLAYDGCMGIEIFGITDLLLVANHVAHAMRRSKSPAIEVHVVSLQGRSITAAGGITLGAQLARGKFDWLIVPGLEVVQGTQWPAKLARLQPELAYIQRSFARGTQIASVCVGSFLLGEAGLLQGRHATTAWIMARELAARYPQAKVNPHAVLLEDGAIITSGAITSTFDLALHLIKRTLGAEVASATARIALLPKPRSSQAQYADAQLIAPPPSSSTTSFASSVAQWLEKRLQEPYSLARLAQAFHVSPRTLMRRVKLETGHSPLTLLQQARIQEAKRLLTHTRWSIAKIVETVGYTDIATFSRLFAREVGETPARYRAR
ncbi:helix-turn-helix domain-containing protein [Variovorax sp. PCZ-1]|uniref:GlxA family transcriptional regulator n=1 Tax=Variovorax sp. PCZ-1 TaxID=2835533 RepID=UPI001BCCFCAB|nr:helix-turn-helix domain-containing protein [Variovorax sp. PCZ-1]MBS7806801.1 helix-turn-helix domain-containing protein [Variovorax sp. PCZ-1]